MTFAGDPIILDRAPLALYQGSRRAQLEHLLEVPGIEVIVETQRVWRQVEETVLVVVKVDERQ